MHAVVVTVSVNDREAARSHVRESVVPSVSGSPGFVAGYWVKGGKSMVVFESEDAARNFADQLQSAPGDGTTIESIDVGEVVAHA